MAKRRSDPEDLHTYVKGNPDTETVEAWLDEHMGERWNGWCAESSGVPDTAMFAQFKQNEASRWVLTGLLLVGEALTADKLRMVPVSALENSWNLTQGEGSFRAEVEALPPLRRAPGMSPEDFSQLVAQHYNAWAKYVPHPADSIAAEWNLKVPTVHTWIREARLRGMLPPAKRGKGKAR